MIKYQKKIIWGLTKQLEVLQIEKNGIENDIEEDDTDSGVVTTEEYTDRKVGEHILESKVNRSVSNVVKAKRCQIASQIPRITKKTSFGPTPTALNFTCVNKSKTITRSHSKTLNQLRSRLSGRGGKSFSMDRCSMA